MQLAEERTAIVLEKDAAVRQTVELQNEVEALKEAVREARAAGTPHGGLGGAVGWQQRKPRGIYFQRS